MSENMALGCKNCLECIWIGQRGGAGEFIYDLSYPVPDGLRQFLYKHVEEIGQWEDEPTHSLIFHPLHFLTYRRYRDVTDYGQMPVSAAVNKARHNHYILYDECADYARQNEASQLRERLKEKK
jgi:hypothetical protein